MTTPIVTELPRRIEPTTRDPFLDGTSRAVREPRTIDPTEPARRLAATASCHLTGRAGIRGAG